MQKGKTTVGDHVRNLVAAGIDPANHNATTPKKMWDALMTQPAAPPQASGVESPGPPKPPLELPPAAECLRPPTGWVCTRPAGHDGPCAAGQLGLMKNQARCYATHEGEEPAPPLELPAPADEDDGAVLAVRLPIDLGAMGQLAGVMAKIYGNGPLQVDTVGSWAVFKIKGGKQ